MNLNCYTPPTSPDSTSRHFNTDDLNSRMCAILELEKGSRAMYVELNLREKLLVQNERVFEHKTKLLRKQMKALSLREELLHRKEIRINFNYDNRNSIRQLYK